MRNPEEKSSADQAPADISQKSRLMLLTKDVVFWHTPDKSAYASVRENRGTQNLGLGRDGSFRGWLTKEYYARHQSVPSAQALQEVLDNLEAKAVHGTEVHKVFCRSGYHNDAVYIDLCDPEYRVVRIDASGWIVTSECPIKFRRSKNMRALPVPVQGGSLDDLRPFVNVASDDDFILLVSALVAGANPTGPYPALVLQGVQGSAKSTTARVLRRLLDPNELETRSLPRDERDLMVAAQHSWHMVYDNVSRISPWLSDALCRVSTGGGIVTRKLFTDGDEFVIGAMRPVLLNGIDEIATRGDLLERSIVLTLPVISHRRTEREFWEQFDRAYPSILGAIYSALSTAIMNRNNVVTTELPRMADFASFIIAAEAALPWDAGQFLKAYRSHIAESNAAVLDSTPIAKAVLGLMAERDLWAGTASDLLSELQCPIELKHAKWPRTATELGDLLTRLAPGLSTQSISLERKRNKKERLIVLRKAVAHPVIPVTTVTVKEIESLFGVSSVEGDNDDKGDSPQQINSKS